MRGPWSQGERWHFVEDREKRAAVDGGNGSASVKLTRKGRALAKKAAARTASNPDSNLTTGAEHGQGHGSLIAESRDHETQETRYEIGRTGIAY